MGSGGLRIRTRLCNLHIEEEDSLKMEFVALQEYTAVNISLRCYNSTLHKLRLCPRSKSPSRRTFAPRRVEDKGKSKISLNSSVKNFRHFQ